MNLKLGQCSKIWNFGYDTLQQDFQLVMIHVSILQKSIFYLWKVEGQFSVIFRIHHGKS